MRIYLDCCALNRPYDDLTQMTVNLEAQAKLHIQFWSLQYHETVILGIYLSLRKGSYRHYSKKYCQK